jgi:hypothetical protein
MTNLGVREMFSLYKNVITGNVMFDEETSDQKIMAVRNMPFHRFKLFQLPVIPFIPKPERGHDTIFSPYKYTYIEGKVGVEYGGAFLVYAPVGIFEGIKDKASLGSEERTILEKIIYDTTNNASSTDYILFTNYFCFANGKAFHFDAPFIHRVSNQGDVLRMWGQEALDPESEQYMANWVHWVLSFLRFINLSNIRIETTPLEHKERKHFQKRKTNQTHYHILKVKKPTLSKRPNEKVGHEETEMPLHQVRGHLADYTEGKGLFGKYNIRVWIPDHWRGDLDYGESIKDYKLEKSHGDVSVS